jgi:hypothetical protein
MAIWVNDDGLRIRFGVEEAVNTKIGEYGAFDPGSVHLVQLELKWEDMQDLDKVVHYAVRLPGANGRTFFLKDAKIYVEEAFASTGGLFTLVVGLDNADGTVFDADGIDADVTQAELAKTADGSEGVQMTGALVGERLANTQPLYVTTDVNGAVPTAGKAWLRLWYYLENV